MTKLFLSFEFCPYCKMENRVKQYGKRKNRQRYKCKECNKLFEEVDY